jgi:hypothetical protein
LGAAHSYFGSPTLLNQEAIGMSEVIEPSYTIGEFCEAERISRPKYYELKNQGLGPREMRHERMVRISHQARLEFQRRLQQPREEQREIDAEMRERARAISTKAVASPRHISKTKKRRSA